MQRLLVIDGHAIMHRAYHALPPLRTAKGIPTNMVYGFFGILQKAIADYKPEHVIVAFDTPQPTFRKELLKTYQSHRPKLENDFVEQINIIKELLDKGGIMRLEQPGFEADDVIGTVARLDREHNIMTLILTGDKDILQLVDEKTVVIAPKVGISKITLYDIKTVTDTLGVPPDKIPDYKALVGDPSDNYPGARGIGPKTALKLIEQFGTIENMLEHIDDIPEERTRKLVSDNIENIKVSKKLARIVTDVKLDKNPIEAQFSGFKTEMKTQLEAYEMNSLKQRIFGKDPQLDLF